MKNISVEPGLSNSIFEGLEERVKGMQEDERVCTLMFDEMSIKKEFFYDKKGTVLGEARIIAFMEILKLLQVRH